VSPSKPRPCPAMACMGSWRTQAMVVLLALGWLPATAQSLGDVARAERERRSKMPHHAPVLSDEDLVRDKILQKAPRDADSASPPSDNGADAATSENVSLGDHARALRQRRAGEQASAPNADANPAIESGPDQKTTSLGDAARQARAEREAARTSRMHSSPPQPAVLDSDTRVAQPRPANTMPTPTTGASPGLARSATLRPKSSPPHTPQSRAVLEPGAIANGPADLIRVSRGSSLWKLAHEHLGDGRLWPVLWKANPQIRDPNRIRAGQLLHCPVLREREPSDSSRSASLKRPSSAGVPAVDSATVPATGEVGQPTPTGLGIRPDERLRKSLFSRALSR